MDWSGYEDVEIVPGKVSGAPVLRGTRVPIKAVEENFDDFMAEGLPRDEAIAATADCYPSAGYQRIKAALDYRATHEPQLQP